MHDHHQNWQRCIRAWAGLCLLFGAQVHADMVTCTPAFNRMSEMVGRGDAYICAHQAEVGAAIDAAASACQGVNAGVDWLAMKGQFTAGAQKCPQELTTPASQGAAPSASGNGPLRSKAVAAERYRDQLQECEKLNSSTAILNCTSAATEQYRNGSNGGSGASGASGSVSTAGSAPDPPSRNPSSPDDPPISKVPPPTAKDPAEDYSGQACSFFTKPAVEEGRTNFYAVDSCVSYGGISYQCVDGRWLKRGPEAVFRCEKAETVESAGTPSGGGPGE